MNTEMPQVTQDEPVENSVAEAAVQAAVIADAEEYLVKAEALHDWFVNETRKENLA